MCRLSIWCILDPRSQGRGLLSEISQRFDTLNAAALIAGVPVKPLRASSLLFGVELAAGWRTHGGQDRCAIGIFSSECIIRSVDASIIA